MPKCINRFRYNVKFCAVIDNVMLSVYFICNVVQFGVTIGTPIKVLIAYFCADFTLFPNRVCISLFYLLGQRTLCTSSPKSIARSNFFEPP